MNKKTILDSSLNCQKLTMSKCITAEFLRFVTTYNFIAKHCIPIHQWSIKCLGKSMQQKIKCQLFEKVAEYLSYNKDNYKDVTWGIFDSYQFISFTCLSRYTLK